MFPYTFPGEGAFGLPPQWWAKGQIMDEYRDMKRSIASSFNVPYLDIRKAFQEEVARHKPVLYCGYLTYDGEHENERGTELLARVYVRAIVEWMQTRQKRQATRDSPSLS